MKYLKKYYIVLSGLAVLFLVFYPFLTYFYVARPTGKELEYFAKISRMTVDFFYFYKEQILFMVSIFLLLAMISGTVFYCILAEKMPKTFFPERKVIIALSAYFLLNVISCLLSEYKEYSFMGLSLDYEGLAAIFGYMVLFLAGAVLFFWKGSEKLLYIGLVSLTILLISGALLECFYGPFFNISNIQEALTPERYQHLLKNIRLDYAGSISLTFGNPGFFGGFCTMLLPVFLGTALTGEKICKQILGGCLTGGLFFCIFMSGSSGALYGAVGIALLEAFFLFQRKRGKAYLVLIGILVAALILLGLLTRRFSLLEESNLLHKAGNSITNTQYEKGKEVFTIEKIQLEQGKLLVDGEQGNFTAEAISTGSDGKEQGIFLTDEAGQEIPFEKQGEYLTGSFDNIAVSIEGNIVSFDFGYQDPVEFYAQDGYLYYIDFNGSLLTEIPQPVITGFEKWYPLFTGRGYIWISSIPLLLDSLVLGKGIGTFPFYYTQSEVAGMLNVHGSADYCIEQAHSWYLQTAVSSGVLSLLCMLFVFFLCLKRGIQDAVKREQEKTLADFVFWGVLAYAVVGLVNNSCVAAAPLFWLLLGYALGQKKRAAAL